MGLTKNDYEKIFLAARWPYGLRCPYCGGDKISCHSVGHQCSRCQRAFRDKTGTVFGGSPLPISKLAKMTRMVAGGSKVSDVAGECEVSYTAAKRISAIVKEGLENKDTLLLSITEAK